MKFKQRISRALQETVKQREEGDRELSPHVVTRYFRAPEIILMDKNYNQKVDIWACGAIFCELLKMKKENWASFLSRKTFFKGKSWAPLSPLKRRKSRKKSICEVALGREGDSIKLAKVNENDQMNCILKVIGTPNNEDLSFMSKAKQKAFLNTYGKYQKKSFSSIFPDEDENWIHLLNQMLEFNPFFRPSAHQLRSHPYFTDLHEDYLKKKAAKSGTTESGSETDDEIVQECIFDKNERLTQVIHQYKIEQKIFN